MQNLLTAVQMREADAYTIEHLPISSINLMEKAAEAFVKAFKKEVPSKKSSIVILCGQGNNGGDGLAIARLLHGDQYRHIKVYLINFSAKQSEDYTENLSRLSKIKVPIIQVTHPEELNGLAADIIIDAVLGSGLDKPLRQKHADLATFINGLGIKVIAVDVPTGFSSEGEMETNYNGIRADLVITFQLPKINFFFPESAVAMDRFKVKNIGLIDDFIEKQPSHWKLTTKADIENLIQPRKNFTHKGTYGHALIIAGNHDTMGAALLAASACLHIGTGLTTVCLPKSGLTALNTSLPEVMALPRNGDLEMEVFEKFSAIAIGPGLGLEEENEELLYKLTSLKKPLVIDADALTCLSKRADLLDQLSANSILTPHMKEFDRIFGQHKNWWQRADTAKKEAKKRSLIIVLKNQYTFVCLPDGSIHINPTGNPAMASGGMGDVLTGIIVGFIAQGYAPADAAILAVYLHGKAGDQLSKKQYAVIATQLIQRLPMVMKAHSG